MNVLLLMVALAIPVEAPKAGLSGAAAASAAVAREVVLVEGGSVLAAKTPGQVLMEKAPLVQATRASLPLLVEKALLVQATGASLPLCVFPRGTEDGGCSLATMYERMRFLSGPWGAWRRLKAARIRGDTAEAERMKALLDKFVIDALEREES